MRLLVFGLGYSASYYVTHHAGVFTHISATTRGALPSVPGVEALVFDGVSVTAALTKAINLADALLVSIPPAASNDPVLALAHAALSEATRLTRIVYLSTIGVYGDQQGAWVDETTPVKPGSSRTLARVEAEQGWLRLGEATGKTTHILRLSGIYGPGQNALENVRAGTARRINKPNQVFNRIHVEDIGRAIAASFASPQQGGHVWNVTDNEPAPPQDVIAYAARLLRVAAPPEIAFADAKMGDMARSFYSENKRVANTRMLRDLGVKLCYPTYREGLNALAASLPPQVLAPT